MNRYTIYCTEEQTKKALELGAPIMQFKSAYVSESVPHCVEYEGGVRIVTVFPTAEQMIGWLEEQGVLIDINPINGLHFYWMLRTKELDEGSGEYMWECQYTTPERDLEYNSRPEATLAAIDAALEYLSRTRSDIVDIRESAKELVAFSDGCVEKIKREMFDKIPEPDDEVRFRKQQEKLRRIYSNKRK